MRTRFSARLRRARTRLVVERDLRALRRHHPYLGRKAERDPLRRALVVSLSDFVYQLKLEAMLLKALELKGVTPTVLTRRSTEATARSVFSAWGIDDVVVLDDWMQADDPEARAAVDELLADRLTVQRLKAWEFRGAHVGRQALSTLSRSLLRGSVDLDAPEARGLLRKLVPNAVVVLLAAERMLDELRPELLLFNERGYAGFGSIFDAALARRLNVVQFVQALESDALAFKRYTDESRAVHPRSLSDETWERVAREPLSEAEAAELDSFLRRRYEGRDELNRALQGWTRLQEPEEVRRTLGVGSGGRKVAVVFSHVLWDANLFYGRDLFEDQGEWLVETVREAAANNAVDWIVKLHPANVQKLRREGVTGELDELRAIREALGPLPPHVRLLLPETEVSTLSLFGVADYAVTIRGTVGVEAPTFGVHVLTSGTSHYSGRGFTTDSETQAEYRHRLRAIHELPPLDAAQVDLARRHAHALFCRRPIRFRSFRTTVLPLDRASHPLAHNLHPTLRSWEELRAAPDLRTFAEWALGDELDYVATRALGASVQAFA